MDIIILLIIAVAVLLAAGFIIVSRLFKSKQFQGGEARESETSYPDVEYEWTQRPSLVGMLLVFLAMLLGVLVYVWFFSDEEGWSELAKIFMAFIGVFIAILGSILRSYTFQIAHDGLYVVVPGSKGERKILFAWSSLRWIKPERDGFRYYLTSESLLLKASEGRRVFRSSKIPCGRETTLVTAIIMARGIPTSPQE